jgi:hypothetical protein
MIWSRPLLRPPRARLRGRPASRCCLSSLAETCAPAGLRNGSAGHPELTGSRLELHRLNQAVTGASTALEHASLPCQRLRELIRAADTAEAELTRLREADSQRLGEKWA